MGVQVGHFLPGDVPRMEVDTIGLRVGVWDDPALGANAEDNESLAAGDKAAAVLFADLPPQNDLVLLVSDALRRGNGRKPFRLAEEEHLCRLKAEVDLGPPRHEGVGVRK